MNRVAIVFTLTLAALCMCARVAHADMPPDLTNTRLIKINLFRQLTTAPQLCIVGSSRAERMSPEVITTMTGLPAFNFAVRSGGPADVYALLSLTTEMDSRPREFIWMLDLEVMRRTTLCQELSETSALLKYLPRWVARAAVKPPDQKKASAPARTGSTALRDYVDGRQWQWSDSGTLLTPYSWDWGDGKVDPRQWDWTRRFYIDFHDSWRGITHLNSWLLSRTLIRLNALGTRPVIVLTPYHPGTLAALKKVGWARHHRELLSLLARLRSRGVRFDLVNLSARPRLIPGWRTGYSDGVHARGEYSDRILRYVVAHSRLSRLQAPGTHSH